MLSGLAGFIVAGCFFISGILYQECRYKNLRYEMKIKALERKIITAKCELCEKNIGKTKKSPLPTKPGNGKTYQSTDSISR